MFRNALVMLTAALAITSARCETGMPGMLPVPEAYGNGSAGARVIDHDQTLRANNQGDINYQFTDFTINAGVTLTIQSGLTLRCSGTFRNNGTVVIQNGADGGTLANFSPTTQGTSQPPAVGISNRPAGNAAIGNDASILAGGLGGEGISEFEARVTLTPGVKAGGGGGASTGDGGDGGGSLVVLAKDAIINNGAITAKGGAATGGGGGGGGGVIILASSVMVQNNTGASIDVSGGTGGSAGQSCAGGGGGGGGIVHLFAPSITNHGSTIVLGGASGPGGAMSSVSAVIRGGGGGGGASGGSGGMGGTVEAGANATPGTAVNGNPGFSLETPVDPTANF